MAATWMGQDLTVRLPTLKSGLAPLQQDISMLLPFLYEAGKQLRDSSSHKYDVSKRNVQSKPLNSDAQVGRASLLPPHLYPHPSSVPRHRQDSDPHGLRSPGGQFPLSAPGVVLNLGQCSGSLQTWVGKHYIFISTNVKPKCSISFHC